jgi:hypothetical protein
MANRFFVSLGVLTMVIVAGSMALAARAPQGSTTAAKRGQAAKPWTVPRMADGQPDLRGIWDFRTITPLERPAVFAGKAFLTDEEAADVEKQKADFEAADPKDRRHLVGGAAAFTTNRNADPVDEQAYNSFWFDNGTKVVATRRTSLIVNRADGRIPYTPEGRERASRRRGTDGPEERGLSERCILSNAGPPMRPGAYNNNVQIFQAPGYIAFLNEMIHDVRVIPLDGRPQIAPQVRQWRGSSRGHWQGTTLVVETTNFNEKLNFSGSTEGLRVVERFTRVGPERIDYEFTVSDPKSFTSPWTAAFPMTKTEAPVYEYACHEGNYGMTNLLSGARVQEKAAEAAKSRK